MQTTQVNTSALALCALMLGAALPLVAQPPVTAGSIKRMRTGGPGNSCSQISSVPTMLVQSPEGLAILKMQAELAAVRAAMAARAEPDRPMAEALRIEATSRKLDSMGRIVIREGYPLRGGRGITYRIFIDTVSSTSRRDSGSASHKEIEANVRALRAQVSSMSDNVVRGSFAPRVTEPAGWVGVWSSGSVVKRVINGAMLMGYCEYPVVESVEPDSPADKAGVAAGDTIVAYNGRDLLEQDVDFAQLLVPGQVLRMRTHRAGKLREVLMIPIKRRDDLPRVIARTVSPCAGSSCEISGNSLFVFDGDSTFTIRVLHDSLKPMPAFGVPTGRGGAGERRPMSGDGPRGGGGAVAGGFMSGSPSPSGFMFASSSEVVAGARLMVIDEDMASTMGLDSAGVMIQSVTPGTPAAEAGLKRGEFVREVNGVAVRDMMAVRKALYQSERIRFLVTSKGSSPRIVTLR